MTGRPRLIALIGVLALGMQALAEGQERSPGFPSICSDEAMHPRRLIRVEQAEDGGSVVAPLVRCTGVELVLGPNLGQDEVELMIPFASVRRLWVRGSQWAFGLAGGLVLGAATGYGIQSIHSNLCSTTGGCPGKPLKGALLGGVIGGFLGWAIGSGLPRWVRRYP